MLLLSEGNIGPCRLAIGLCSQAQDPSCSGRLTKDRPRQNQLFRMSKRSEFRQVPYPDALPTERSRNVVPLIHSPMESLSWGACGGGGREMWPGHSALPGYPRLVININDGDDLYYGMSLTKRKRDIFSKRYALARHPWKQTELENKWTIYSLSQYLSVCL